MKKLITAVLLLAGLATGQQSALNTFTAGELSPHLNARYDFAKYASGCRTLENMIVLPYGGVVKRPGTQYISNTRSNSIARLIPFSVGVDQSYVLEMGGGYIRVYSDGVLLTDTNDVPIEVVTPYATNDLFQIQTAQFADTLYLAHPDYPPYQFQRTSVAPTFTMEEVVFDWPAIIGQNETTTTILPSGVSGSITLSSSTNLFTTNHVGAAWVFRLPSASNSVTLTATNSGVYTSATVSVEGNWSLLVQNVFSNETLTLQTSEDNGQTWGDYRVYGNQPATDYDRTGTETEVGVKYRMVMSVTNSGTATFRTEASYLNGWVTITNYLSATQVQARVDSDLGSAIATTLWYEGAFSKERGYPRCVEFFQNRLWFAGTDYQVNTLWGSMTDDYLRFKTGTSDDDALQISINSDNVIQWLLSRSQLFVGTLGDEWIVDGGDSATPLTPTSILARKQTGYGSKTGIEAIIASDSILYLQRQGRKLREFEFSLEADAYKSIDLTVLAEHITEGGVIQIAEQQQPEPIIWCVRGDGQLIGMTYSKAENVFGWHRHVTDGEFESVAVIPTDGEDRVYVVVNRDNGRFVEWLTPFDWGSDDSDAWFVDSGLDYDGGDSVIYSINKLLTNGTLVDCTNSFSTGDYLRIEGTFLNKTNPSIAYQVLSATSTNFVLDFVYVPQTIVVTNAGTTNLNGTWYHYSDSRYYQTNYVVGQSIPVGGAILYSTGSKWVLGYPSTPPGTGVYTNSSTETFLPKTGWLNAGLLTDPAPTLVYDLSGTGTVRKIKNTFTNVSHLAGQTVAVFADGGAQPNGTVSTNGVLITSNYHNRVIAGLPYSARISPMHIEIATSTGSSYGKIKTPYKAHFRVKDSGVFKYGSATNRMYDVTIRKDTLPVGQPVPFFTGDPTTKMVDSPSSTAPEFWVISDKPLPLELLSLTIFTKVTEYE